MARRRRTALPPAVQELLAAARPVLRQLQARSWPAAAQVERLDAALTTVEALDGVWYDRALHDRVLAILRETRSDARRIEAMLVMLARASGLSPDDIAAAMAPEEAG